MRRDDWLLAQLPVGMTEHDFLRRFLTIFQDLGDTILHQIDTLDRTFDPTVAPASMVREMGRWIGLDWIDSDHDVELQRRAVIEYANILQWRGTKKGVAALLRLISDDDDVTVVDSGGIYQQGNSPRQPPHVQLGIPRIAYFTADDDVAERSNIADVIRILRAELPANVTFELTVAGQLVWPPDGASGGEQRIAQEVS